MWQVDWTPPEGLPGWPIFEDEDDVIGATDEERETREAYLAQRTVEAVGVVGTADVSVQPRLLLPQLVTSFLPKGQALQP
jgi:hypothetical protein